MCECTILRIFGNGVFILFKEIQYKNVGCVVYCVFEKEAPSALSLYGLCVCMYVCMFMYLKITKVTNRLL